MIDVRDLRFRYPDAATDTLAGIDWRVKRGEIVLVAGQSGSGKSSLLRCLNGLIPHFLGGYFAGEVLIDGINTKAASPGDLARTIGTVFQDPESQLVTDSARDELGFALENLGFDPGAAERRTAAICERLGIGHLLDRHVGTLSGGERQMVAIAAALAPEPGVIVLDEPTSQLAPDSSARILDALICLRDTTGLTVIIAEHRIQRILPLAGNVLLLRNGRATSYPGDAALPALQAAGLAPPVRHPGPDTIRQAGPALVALDGVHFNYGSRRVLNGADLAIHAGETVALIGPNGSGKTTLLKHLIGLLRPERGAVRLLGDDARALPVHEIARTVGYVPQQPSLILHRESVAAELRFTLQSLGRSGSPEDILRALGIAHHVARHPLDLSGGERQRVAIAALAVAGPRLLLFDEPTRGLPWSEKLNLALALRDYADRGHAVLVATHDLDFAEVFAQRIVRLSEGRLEDVRTSDAASQALPTHELASQTMVS